MHHTKTVRCQLLYSFQPFLEKTVEEVGAETLPVCLYCGKIPQYKLYCGKIIQ